MSKAIETSLEDILVTEFWGGASSGKCLQLTHMVGGGYVQITMEEASVLMGVMAEFIKGEAKRRQRLLRDQLEDLRMKERLVFHEIAELSEDLLCVPKLSVSMISAFCPKSGDEERWD